MEAHLTEIAAAVRASYEETIRPIGARFSFVPGPSSGEIEGPPTVLLVGNHSSGKSTFINHLLGADVQKTGLAPTDDSFTLIGHAETARDRDGRAVVSDADLPWDGLAEFGPTLLSHLGQKLRPLPLLERVTLIDTPGMIDSAVRPTSESFGGGTGAGAPNRPGAARRTSDRGYDFAGVVRWFAERADLVLLFFDPDKPGTTGETLDVFTQSLADLRHKLAVVMNKVDRFRGIQDFARAYGALCWNLAKVSPLKDLPLIYTTYVPLETSQRPALPTGDFEASREELSRAIYDAPTLHADNLVTRLGEDAARLRAHARVVDAVGRELRRRSRRDWGLLALGGLLGAVGTATSVYADGPLGLSLGLGGLTGLGLFVGHLLRRRAAKRARQDAIAGLDTTFQHVHGREVLARDRAEDVSALWSVTRERTRRTVEALPPKALPGLRRRELRALNEIVDRTVPDLRRRVRAPEAGEPAEEAASLETLATGRPPSSE